MFRRAFCVVLSLLMLLPVISGCTPKKQRFEKTITGFFDTVTTFVAYMETEDEFNSEAKRIMDDLSTYHALSSIFQNYEFNNIKTINDGAGNGVPVKVSIFIIDMLTIAKDAYKKTNGAVNPALGSVTSVWREYINKGIADETFSELPEMSVLEQADQHTDIEKLIIDKENETVYLEDPAMSIDVGAFAKGYAASLALYNAKSRGVDSMLLNIGGSVSTIGKKGDGSAWRVAVQDPRAENESIYTVALENMSVITSGDYQRFYTVDGVRYHHVIDPKTLMPVRKTAAVTVVCEDPVLGDSMSTALMALPIKEAMELAASTDALEASWVTEDGIFFSTDGFNDFVIAKES